jgi:hypothetical protein
MGQIGVEYVFETGSNPIEGGITGIETACRI